MNEKILVIAAHPDDEVLGVGGTIARHVKDGNEVHIFIIGEGVAERHGRGASEKIKQHAFEAAKILGVKSENVSFGGHLYDKRFDDSHLTDLIVLIEKKIEEICPETIYTHHFGDANTDHGFVFRATMAAVRPIAKSNREIKKILLYETSSSTDQSFQFSHTQFCPNVFIDISDYLGLKKKALECYKTEIRQWPHPRSTETINNLAKYRGSTVMKGAAEAFVLAREVK